MPYTYLCVGQTKEKNGDYQKPSDDTYHKVSVEFTAKDDKEASALIRSDHADIIDPRLFVEIDLET